MLLIIPACFVLLSTSTSPETTIGQEGFSERRYRNGLLMVVGNIGIVGLTFLLWKLTEIFEVHLLSDWFAFCFVILTVLSAVLIFLNRVLLRED